jgi:hypothetical protein
MPVRHEPRHQQGDRLSGGAALALDRMAGAIVVNQRREELSHAVRQRNRRAMPGRAGEPQTADTDLPARAQNAGGCARGAGAGRHAITNP